MSYLVLARKYRPKTFADVVGQPHVIRPLVNALKSGRIAHAYLFSGARGVGKTTVARLLAMALNCGEIPENRPCGQCESCRQIIEGQAVDVFEVDGASNRGINEIRDLRETIKYLPSSGKVKVYIIDEVHMLTKEAFNALLKTLEEPPEHVVFIFATTESHKVLPTILSRCQRYDFKRIPVSEIMERLAEIAKLESVDISPDGLRLIAREADGSLRDSMSLFDQVIAFAGMTVKDEDVAGALGLIDQTIIAEMAEALLKSDAALALELLDRVYEFGFDNKDFAEQMLEYYRRLTVVKIARNPEKILDLLASESAELQKRVTDVSLETLNFHFNAWLEVQGQLHRAAQPRLVLEALVIRLCQVEPLQSVAELTARLEGLIQALGLPEGSFDSAGRPGPMTPPNAPPRSAPPNGSSSGSRRFGPSAVEPEESRRSSGPAKRELGPGASSGALDWAGFMARVSAEAPLTASSLKRGQVRDFGPDKVVVAFGSEGDLALVDKDRVAGYLNDFFGSRPKLELKFEAEAAAALVENANNAAAAKEQARGDVVNHPMVKEAKQIFSGEIIDVLPEK